MSPAPMLTVASSMEGTGFPGGFDRPVLVQGGEVVPVAESGGMGQQVADQLQMAYSPPAVVKPTLRRRPPGERTAAA
jgi:hypothetical protein